MADLIFLPLPGVGTLAMTREQFDAALNAGRDVVARPAVQAAPAATHEPRLLNARELEEATGVPQSWWMAQARERRIPFRKIGRRVRFTLEEVLACEAFKRREIPIVNSRQ